MLDNVSLYGCMDAWVCVCMDVWVYGYMTNGRADVWVYVCMDVWVYVCIYKYMYKYIYTHTRRINANIYDFCINV